MSKSVDLFHIPDKIFIDVHILELLRYPDWWPLPVLIMTHTGPCLVTTGKVPIPLPHHSAQLQGWRFGASRTLEPVLESKIKTSVLSMFRGTLISMVHQWQWVIMAIGKHIYDESKEQASNPQGLDITIFIIKKMISVEGFPTCSPGPGCGSGRWSEPCVHLAGGLRWPGHFLFLWS